MAQVIQLTDDEYDLLVKSLEDHKDVVKDHNLATDQEVESQQNLIKKIKRDAVYVKGQGA